MTGGEISRTALGEVLHHKGRSCLTLLGIVLGTLSITVMTSLLDGVVATVQDGIEQLGYDGVVYAVSREARDLKDASLFQHSKGLQPSDADVLRARARTVQRVAPIEYYEQNVRYAGVERKARVLGVTQDYAPVRNRAVVSGRFVQDSDERAFAKVCVLGHRLAARLFGTDDPVGKSIAIGGRQFAVIGVGEKLGNMFVHDHDAVEEMEGLYIPLATLRKFYTDTEGEIQVLAIKTADVAHLGELTAEVKSGLMLAHRGAEDFRIENIAEEIVKARQQVKQELANWRIVLGTIAGISLLVGGIGLLSVMLISIGERLYEIGLRKAIGATDAHIFVQFLVEAVVLALVGGILGAGLGVVITKIFGSNFESGLPIHLDGVAAAIGISVLLGAAYGIYPALIAARMSPVDALRTAA